MIISFGDKQVPTVLKMPYSRRKTKMATKKTLSPVQAIDAYTSFRRDIIAAIALAGVKTSTPENSAKLAVQLADALIVELDAPLQINSSEKPASVEPQP